MRNVLALDLATVTGWAIASADSPPAPSLLEIAAGARRPVFPSGAHRIAPPSTSIGTFAKNYDIWLRALIAEHDIDCVVFEAPILTSGRTSIDTARKLLGLAWHTEFVCADLRISQVSECAISTIKKHATGSGRSPDLTSAARQRFGNTIVDDNHADALFLLNYFLSLRDRGERRPNKAVEEAKAVF